MTAVKFLAMLCLIILVALLVVYLYKDSIGKNKSEKAEKKSPAKKVRNPLDNSPTELVNAPVLFIRLPGHKKYLHYEMKKTPLTIGTAKNADLRIIEDEKVQPHHAKIQKVTDKGRSYYVFINLAKTNPSEYRNKASKSKNYEVMDYKDSQELDKEENFYIGDTKIMIKTPVGTHDHTDTDKMKAKPGKRSDAQDGAEGTKRAAAGKRAEAAANEEVTNKEMDRTRSRRTYQEVREEEIDIRNTDPYKFDV
ncbi:MAG TPA: hypothetical protein DCF49_00745 [Lachnospiraceae bacterium]|jgi:hypothetical protein|nr:hypothetical protein [Lachnospiraceae bacterium]